MQLKDVMTRDVATARPETTLAEVAKMMRDRDVGPMPVVAGAKVVGVVTDRDIAIRATADGLDPRVTRAADVMSTNVLFCYEDQDVEDAAKLMSEQQVRRLLVFDRASNLAGIVSLGDLALEADDDRMTAKVLNRVSQPGQAGPEERERRT